MKGSCKQQLDRVIRLSKGLVKVTLIEELLTSESGDGCARGVSVLKGRTSRKQLLKGCLKLWITS